MHDFLAQLFLALLVSYLVAWLFCAVPWAQFLRRLRETRPVNFDPLGNVPTWWWSSRESRRRLRRYVLDKGYETAGDPALAELGRRARNSYLLGLGLMIGCIAIVALTWIVRM
jgi:hypothetical protein